MTKDVDVANKGAKNENKEDKSSRSNPNKGVNSESDRTKPNDGKPGSGN